MLLVLFGIGGCEPATPTRAQLKATDHLVTERTGAPFDTERLLRQADLSDARTPATGVLTREQAVQRTLQRNLSLLASAEDLTIARAQVAQASLIQNPTLGQSSGLLFPFGTGAGLPSFDVNVAQALNSIFTQPARVRVARLQELQAQIDLASSAFDLLVQAESKYEEMCHLVRSRRVAERVVQVYDRAVKAAEARQQVGLIPQPELNRARLNYTDAVRQVRHLQMQYRRAAGEMNWLMGDPGVPQWTLPEDEIRPPPNLPLIPPDQTLEDLGQRYRLDLARAEYDRQISAFNVKLARIGMFPELTVGGEFARDGSKRWSGGPFFNLQLPIFDPGFVAVTLAEDQQRKADKAYRAAAGQVRQDVRAAVSDLRIAADDLRFFREQLMPQQEQNVQLMQESFRLGNDDLDALLNTLHDYVTALQSYEDATQAYQDSGVALQRAVGMTWTSIRQRLGTPTTRPAPAYQAIGASRAASAMDRLAPLPGH